MEPSNQAAGGSQGGDTQGISGSGAGEFNAGQMDDASLLAAVGADGQDGGDSGGNAGDGQQQAAANDGDWNPPTREEWEAMQTQLSTVGGLAEAEIERMLQESAANDGNSMAGEQGAANVDVAALEEMLKPKTFTADPELVNKVLVDGDGAALGQLFTNLMDVMTHNHRIDMNNAILNGIKYAQPIHKAVDKFNDKYPELLGLREKVENHMWNVRQRFPQANELQILRFTEKHFKPIIDRARQIASQHAGGGTRNNLAPAPAGGGQQSPPHGRVSGGPAQPVSTEEMLAQSRAFDLQHTY